MVAFVFAMLSLLAVFLIKLGSLVNNALDWTERHWEKLIETIALRRECEVEVVEAVFFVYLAAVDVAVTFGVIIESAIYRRWGAWSWFALLGVSTWPLCIVWKLFCEWLEALKSKHNHGTT